MQTLIDLAHSLSPFVVGAEGNISAACGDGMLIKASGTRMFSLKNSDLVLCDANGNKANKIGPNPSIEVGFHAHLLSYEGIRFVAHTHPTNTLKILCSNHAEEFAKARLFPDHVVYNGSRSCYIPYVHPGSELSEAVALAVKNHIADHDFPKVILLQNHGIICAGKTASECLIATQICEKAAEIFCGVVNIERYTRLNDSSIDRINRDEKESYRKKLIQ